MYIFIDESGDLGFDFSKPGPSKYFTITLLVCESEESHKAVNQAVRKTLRRKLNHSNKKRPIQELKGISTTLEVKRYFLNHLPNHGWYLHSITINKSKIHPHSQLKINQHKLYNSLTKKLLSTLIIPQNINHVSIIIDKSKGSTDRKEFNTYIKTYLEYVVNLDTHIYIKHEDSPSNAGIQAVDMFCWGIQQKESSGNDEWLRLYHSKVIKHVKLFE